jgi:hypothetical protein
MKGKTAIALRAGDRLDAGTYTLILSPKKGDDLRVDFDVEEDYDLESLPRIAARTNSGSGVQGTSTALLEGGVRGTFDAATTYGYGVIGENFANTGIAIWGRATSTSGDTVGVLGESKAANGTGLKGLAGSQTGGGVGVLGVSDSEDGIAVLANMTSNGGANSVALQVDHSGTVGNIARFQRQGLTYIRFDMNGKGYFNGGTQVGGADFAESVAVKAAKRKFEPGDVLVIDTTGERRFALSTVAESPLVAGIYSTRPGVLARPGPVAGGEASSKTEVPLAITGIVPCKVCDEGGKIRAGDLLVAASIPGHAKRAPRDVRPGTLVGKALGRLKGKKGKIEVLITMR